MTLYRDYKVILFGGGGVGKTALKIQFVYSCFVLGGYDLTIDVTYQNDVLIEAESVPVEVWEASGPEEYCPLGEKSLSVGFLLIYSIAERDSFYRIPLLYDQLLRVIDQDVGTVPILIVGNKCDLEFEREVAESEGRDLAKRFGCEFMETSAKTRLNVDEIFINIVLNIHQRNKDQTTISLTDMDALNEPPEPEESNTAGCRGCVVL